MSSAGRGNNNCFAIRMSSYKMVAIIHDQSPNRYNAGRTLRDIHVMGDTKLRKLSRYDLVTLIERNVVKPAAILRGTLNLILFGMAYGYETVEQSQSP